MNSINITIAGGDYDRTRPIADGRVRVEGCNVTYLKMLPQELFFRAIRYAEFDVTELSISSYMLQVRRGVSPYTAIPVFLSRSFRQSNLFIRTDRGIRVPGDLRGKVVGCPEYQLTAAVWLRGLLKDEHGIDSWEMKWRTGGLETPGREERAPITLPSEYDYAPIRDNTLSDMLEKGEIDALISPHDPSCFKRSAANVARMWPDYRSEEQAYYSRTGLFPVMHLVAVKKDLVAAHPWLPEALYDAFSHAKDIAIEDLKFRTVPTATLPWLQAEVEATEARMGKDYWPYGLARNREVLERLIRYSAEQHLAEPGLTPEDLFHETTLAPVASVAGA
jgi:4,5-dihydroxyphthalate decarboxylase